MQMLPKLYCSICLTNAGNECGISTSSRERYGDSGSQSTVNGGRNAKSRFVEGRTNMFEAKDARLTEGSER